MTEKVKNDTVLPTSTGRKKKIPVIVYHFLSRAPGQLGMLTEPGRVIKDEFCNSLSTVWFLESLISATYTITIVERKGTNRHINKAKNEGRWSTMGNYENVIRILFIFMPF